MLNNYYIEGILQENGEVLQKIYSNYYPRVVNFICRNSGTEEDAKDIFQDAIIVIFMKARKNPQFLSVNFGAFLSRVCKFLWLKQLRHRTFISHDYSFNFTDGFLIEDSIEDEIIQMEKHKLFYRYFDGMGQECQKLLTFFLDKVPVKEITERMGYSSIQYARNRKTNCKNILVRKIMNSPEYKELKNEQIREDSAVPRW